LPAQKNKMKSIQQLQQTNGTFSVGQAIGDGWNLVSKHLGYYIGAGIIAVFIGAGVGFIPIAGGIANNLIISPCFMASAILITWQISRGYGWNDFGEMFKGFNYLTPVLISSLIQGVIMLILAMLCFFSFLPELFKLFELTQGTDAYSNQDEIAEMAKGLLLSGKIILFTGLFMLALLFISCIWAFKIHFIAVYNMQAWPAMELSRRVCTPNILRLAGLIIILGIIIAVSILPCGIGLLFSLPLSIGAMYSAFAQITGCDQPDEVEDMFDFTNGQNKSGQPNV
jgi:hypothetical protein